MTGRLLAAVACGGRPLAAVAMVLGASCASPQACTAGPRDPSCPDLRFGGRYYDEWRQARDRPASPADLQEVGNATYPACNDREVCGRDLEGFAATDVWLVDGVDTDDAVLGFRQDTSTYVVFVRRGLDPAAVVGLDPQP